MTLTQQIIIIACVVLGTLTTRFLPFLVFSSDKETPQYIKYLGYMLPPAVFGLLVVYSLREVEVTTISGFLPELLAVGLIIILHYWKKSMLLSIAGGTIFYMILVQMVF
ncbi:branched-chain amino acid transport protein AzlD [Jeotgalicoccus coquinae]|uniref:Branched-chain amino acid transport protein (AzlD) n=1 Tax=Jeotgalicoccus coquinae TaxID=709509 RepID=A0A6V7R0F9_9STAP|nr:AzlD domain-containing protein [Jeotgalicoccus coquinae]MBB6423763.1 branched-subunit amino acid transport protein AzlD [Jeotgalicoccus coquinae]GGE22392.1 branched-chain amino acid transport protein AzlD [Jeotgalicoccus coquinae]CAD2070786.1 Branched-chain amino acid transport protein (AzlD) [Jeotgalicoccus coquinae]